jgi:hypothetical protein
MATSAQAPHTTGAIAQEAHDASAAADAQTTTALTARVHRRTAEETDATGGTIAMTDKAAANRPEAREAAEEGIRIAK